jgi:DNA-binding NtrC family response regulator
MLNKSGFSVIEASDGSAAMKEMRAHKPTIDVLFLDMTLPGVPSREVFEEARRLRPQMRVIVTSAYAADVAAASLQVRIERFIRKPYSLVNLVDLIRQAVT